MPVRSYFPLLVCCFAIETGCATYGLLAAPTAATVSVVYALAGLGIVWSLLHMPALESRRPVLHSASHATALKALLAVTMLGLAFITARYWFAEIDIDPDFADMLPVIRVMNERLLSGHPSQVYAMIPELWGGTRPIYLPAMWLPYAPAIHFNFDMRWVTVVCLLACFSLFLWLLRWHARRVLSWMLLLTAAVLFWWVFAHDEVHGLLSLSEAGPVILYYCFLTLTLVSGNAVAIGIAIFLCLMSRYSLVGWIPAYGLFLLAKREYRKAVIISVVVLTGTALFFLLPFGWGPVNQMLHLPASYTAFAAKVWRDNPETFWLNLGLAKFFGPARIALLHGMLVYGSFLLPIGLALFCILKRKNRYANVPLALLKFTLLVFYQLVDVPYGYLFYTASFVSLIAVALASRAGQEKSAARIA